MKIYDCFTFYNEFDLLELRLEEHYEYVDHFVIAEANKTHQGRDKSFFLEDNWEHYAKYRDKIIHVKVKDMPTNDNAWVLENFQRNSLSRGYVNAHDDDIIIISDVDEMLRPEVIDDMRRNPRDMYGFRAPYFNFKFNYMLVDDKETYFIWSVAGKKKHIQIPEDFRTQRWHLSRLEENFDDGKRKVYEHAGWHFSYLGDNESIKTKLRNFAHAELNKDSILNQINVEDMMNRGVGFNPLDTRPFVKVALDNYFPKTILKNKEKYSKYIVDDAKNSAYQYLPAVPKKQPIPHFYDTIDGWFNFLSIYSYAIEQADSGDHFVEVGAWKGRSASFMAVEIANSGKDIKFDVVDTWEGSAEHKDNKMVKDDTLYDNFINNMKPVEGYFNPVRATSLEAADLYEDNSLALVLLDASYQYEDVKADIAAWLPKVQPGGILAGDDYHHTWPGVIQAVDELLPEREVIDNITWAFEKPITEYTNHM